MLNDTYKYILNKNNIHTWGGTERAKSVFSSWKNRWNRVGARWGIFAIPKFGSSSRLYCPKEKQMK